jgi:two-component system sensor histidine kinase ChvG
MAQVTALPMAEYAPGEGAGPSASLNAPGRFALTGRILAVNILPLLILGGGLFYLDSYRTQLINERLNSARIEAQITAEALAGATPARQEALLVQIGKEQRMRLRTFNAKGRLTADSFALAPPAFRFDEIADDDWEQRFSRWLDRTVDTIVSAEPLPDYREPEANEANAWPELARARELGLSQVRLYDWSDGSPVITAAVPVGLRGATLLTLRNAVDITESVRTARTALFVAMLLVMAASAALSLFLARTIVTPLRLLARAAARVKQGRDREVEVPRLPERSDEIGLLARAVSDMTGALRQRIDAVDSFAADVAHEIKNPLASLRNAIDTLPRVEDPDLRQQLIGIAAHDVRRIDRLVTEISAASRVDAEISRARLERVDLAALFANLIASREDRAMNGGRQIALEAAPRAMLRVMGVPSQLERVAENLIDNAISFSPPDGEVLVRIRQAGRQIITEVIDAGPGIAPDRREAVFRRFHSDRPDDESFGNHSGLGLAIGRAIAVAHEGALVADDRPDGAAGACLRLTLPAAP